MYLSDGGNEVLYRLVASESVKIAIFSYFVRPLRPGGHMSISTLGYSQL